MSAPVLRHFDPSLHTAVHVDGSQNAVGEVLLQWQENEDNPRPVAFMSRKLSGVQYRYDARNVEALAAQMALTTWCTLLLGEFFEIFSDHDSLQYLFTQKFPSQRIFRLCEFLADGNFEEVKYVPGPQNVYFLSRPWEATEDEPASFHMLVKRWPKPKSCWPTKTRPVQPSVIVMPTWQNQLAVRDKDRASGLRSLARTSTKTSAETARQAIRAVSCVSGHQPLMASSRRVDYWRADYEDSAHQWEQVNGWPYSWIWLSLLPARDRWHVPHFESLGNFGVWQGVSGGTVILADSGPVLQGPHHLGVIQQSTGASHLITEIQKAVTTDSYLSGVLQLVLDSNYNLFRDFFLDVRETLCYQQVEDACPRVCVPAVFQEAVLRAAHGDSTLAGHPGIIRTTAAVSHAFYWPGLHADVMNFVRTCKTCAASKSSNHQRLGMETYSAIPIQPLTSWDMDLIGPMPRSKDGNEWIVTLVDRTSKTAHKHTFAEDLAKLTFKEICCQFGLPQHLTMDNAVRFVSSLWKSLWHICGTKLRFTSSYYPQADPAERANHQVLEALRAVVTVVQYDEWNRALTHITFSLNNHISTATRTSPFEFAHGFTARTQLTLGITDDRPLPVDMKTSKCRQDYDHAKDMARKVLHRHQAAADHMAGAQVRLGQMLAKRVTPACIKVGDLLWMDSKHTPNDVPYKLTARWFSPFKVLKVRGAQAILDLPPLFGKTHNRINMSWLKFFEARDAELGEADAAPEPLLGHDGVMHYEIKRICNARTHKKVRELWVEWQGYDQSQNGWVSRESLMQDVPALVWAFERNPSNFTPRASAPKRASVVPRSVSVVHTSGRIVTSPALVAAVSGPIVMVTPKNKVQSQTTKSVVVSLGHSSVGNPRTGLRSQKG